MRHRNFHLILCLLLPLLLSACDSDLVDRGSRYLERVKLGLLDRFSSKISANREPLSILDFLPQPNYSGNADSADRQQLVDGELIRPPMWTDKGSVGWFGHTPVLIEALRESSQTASGTLRIHAGKGDYADSSLPRQIDVYTNSKAGTRVAGSYKENPAVVLEDKRNYWIEVPVSDVGQRLVIALHANSSHLHIDEVEFVPASRGGDSAGIGSNEILTVTSLEELRSDASARLRLNMELGATDRTQNRDLWRQAYGQNKVVSWVADPWLHRLDKLKPEAAEVAGSINVAGTNSEYETFAVGLYFTGIGLQEVTVDLQGIPASAIEILELQHVLTANGDLAFDPLVPLRKDTFKLQSGWPVLAWFKVDLRMLKPGTHEAEVTVTAGAAEVTQKRFPVHFDVMDARKLKPTPIQAVVWGYTSDMPIWSDPQRAIEDQLNHYVNVWTIHPENIPGLSLNGKLEPHKRQRLEKDLALYKGKGLVRLYSGWTLENNPLGMTIGKPEVSNLGRQAYSRWLSEIQKVMSTAGYGVKDWELYPLDEPSGPGLEALVSIARIIRDELPGVGIYANPITTHTHPSNETQLRALVGLVDSWQPMLSFARQEGAGFFNTLEKNWGFYHNPPVPAKFADPVKDYRAQGWWAWQLGGSSVGFWSYSDSTGSSVWDDFDGRRPDFSVVYEKSGRLVSSRRWEGFAEGVEDYLLLAGSGLNVERDLDLTALDSKSIEKWRRKALDALLD